MLNIIFLCCRIGSHACSFHIAQWREHYCSGRLSRVRISLWKFHFHLKSTVPSKLQVNRAEVENIYRSMPEKFRVPGKENWGIIEVRDRQNAENARALLLQGSSFESVAERFSSGGIRSSLPRELTEKKQTVKVGEISPVMKSENGWIVAKLHSRGKNSILPLEKVYTQLALELESAKESAALAEILQKRLARKKIIYIPLKQ